MHSIDVPCHVSKCCPTHSIVYERIYRTTAADYSTEEQCLLLHTKSIFYPRQETGPTEYASAEGRPKMDLCSKPVWDNVDPKCSIKLKRILRKTHCNFIEQPDGEEDDGGGEEQVKCKGRDTIFHFYFASWAQRHTNSGTHQNLFNVLCIWIFD